MATLKQRKYDTRRLHLFEEEEEYTDMNHCKRSCRLDDEGNLCDCCRLWDAYIPKTATVEQMAKAMEWQNMPLDEQPDYDEYF